MAKKINKNIFSEKIELIAIKNRMTCLDVILEYCNRYDIEPEQIAKNVNAALKAKLKNDLNIKKENNLLLSF
jgi:hypothetical protein